MLLEMTLVLIVVFGASNVRGQNLRFLSRDNTYMQFLKYFWYCSPIKIRVSC